MTVFYSNDFQGFNPVGTSAIVVASDIDEAEVLLLEAIRKEGLPQSSFTLNEINLSEKSAVILQNGDY